MFRGYFERYDDAPLDIDWFERLWLAGLSLTVVITIMVLDWSLSSFGIFSIAFYISARFSGSFLLMLFCSRRRSNIARWLLAIPFQATIIAFDVIQWPEIEEQNYVAMLVVLRLGLMLAATCMLFTSRSPPWFATKHALAND